MEASTALLEVEPLDLGADVKAVGLELMDRESREPLRAADAARIWSAILPALAGTEPRALDFFTHLDRVRDFCRQHEIASREAATRCIVVPAPQFGLLKLLLRFEGETFGLRAGNALPAEDAELEAELARRGVDAYQPVFGNYFFCGVCDFENGFLALLSGHLWANQVIRRTRPAVNAFWGRRRPPAIVRCAVRGERDRQRNKLPNLRIEALSTQNARRHLGKLAELLQDAVASGASVGFLPPLDTRSAQDYWNQVFDAVASGNRLLLAAMDQENLGHLLPRAPVLMVG